MYEDGRRNWIGTTHCSFCILSPQLHPHLLPHTTIHFLSSAHHHPHVYHTPFNHTPPHHCHSSSTSPFFLPLLNCITLRVFHHILSLSLFGLSKLTCHPTHPASTVDFLPTPDPSRLDVIEPSIEPVLPVPPLVFTTVIIIIIWSIHMT